MRDYSTLHLDMDVNEHERLFNITLKTQIKVKEHCCYCCSTFHSHKKFFINKHNLYPKMIVNGPSIQLSTGTIYLCHFDVIFVSIILLPRCRVINR